MVEAHVGDNGRVVVKMLDAQGAETNRYDVMSGVQYSSSSPDQVSVVDEDAEPKDAQLQFLTLTPDGESGAVITITFDGDPGDGVRQVTLQSEEIRVVPGDAVGGEVVVEVTPV